LINKYCARILEMVIQVGGPTTGGMLLRSLNISQQCLYENLGNMVSRGELQKKKFTEEGINPLDYKLGEKGGGVPTYFFAATKAGVKKYEYYKSKGIYDEEDTNRQEWQQKKGVLTSE